MTWLNKQVYIERKMKLICQTCHRKRRLLEKMLVELPEEGFFDDLDKRFYEIYHEEV